MPKASQLLAGLTTREAEYARRALGREPNEVEWAIIEAEWSEHCSYKSSREILRLLPTKGDHILVGPGYDAGVVDVGGGYVVSLHIESHNHPSAVDPYGGAATGIGGVLRDILSMGTRPVALVDLLRFGRVDKSKHSQWLLRNVVRGISDYGNCVGVPTVAGEVEFDESFERNCLVDVACVGLGRRKDLVFGEAKVPGDVLVLAGGSTGRDGIGGATFASRNLGGDAELERSAVQVPDPFAKKLLLDALLEAIDAGVIRGMKDLGGGGFASALSEVASKGETGVDVELKQVNLREPDMTPAEIMVSESQERMILILEPKSVVRALRILRKYGVPCSIMGKVTGDGFLTIRYDGEVVARIPAELTTHAPTSQMAARKPRWLSGKKSSEPHIAVGLSKSLLSLLSSPNIASRRWIYEQFDHEVGVRTIVKPGMGDASVLKLPNGKLLALKGDGNSKTSFLDPYNGAAGCVSEACRNVVAVGAKPIALADHLQFGDPGDPEVYWCFREAVKGIADYCNAIDLPVVGGKVSFYNQDVSKMQAIKPTPIALVIGLMDDQSHITTIDFKNHGDLILAIGENTGELGGSEYYQYLLDYHGGTPAKVNPAFERRTNESLLRAVREGLMTAVHDCSKGGFATALAEMCMTSRMGARVDVGLLNGPCTELDSSLFSEGHGRFLVSASPENADRVERVFRESRVPCSVIGEVGGEMLTMTKDSRRIINLAVDEMTRCWESCLPLAMGDSR